MDIKCIQTGIFNVNTYIVPLKNNECFITDPAACTFCRDTESFMAFLNGTGWTPAALVLTHGHFDHVAGLKFLREKFPEIKIYIHKEDAALIGKNSAALQSSSLEAMGLEAFLPAVSDLPEATDFLYDGEKLFDEWTVLHTPGHTKGSCCFYNENEKVLLSGDTVFYGSWGRTDLAGGSERDMMHSLTRIKENIPGSTLVYPGHDYYGFTLSDGM